MYDAPQNDAQYDAQYEAQQREAMEEEAEEEECNCSDPECAEIIRPIIDDLLS